MRVLRILGFSTIYFALFVIHAVSFAVRNYAEVQSAEFSWYLLHPLNALSTILSELSRQPIFRLSFAPIILGALVLGFITDLGFIFLKKRMPDRKRPAESFA